MIVKKNSPLGFLSIQLLFFVTAWLIAKLQFGNGFSDWGFIRSTKIFKQMGFGLLIGIIIYGVTFTISILSGAERIILVPTIKEAIIPFSLFVFGNFFSSFSEDILTRGYVFAHTKKKIGNIAIILVSSSIYVLNHIYRLGDGIETYSYLFLLGVIFIIPLVKTKQIWTTGSIHWAGNCTFYFTHEIIKTQSQNSFLSPNIILSIVIICFIIFFPHDFQKILE
ncbi:MAG: CPBP family intramembrane glutamic endopeptidase [Flectobacillus sp.]|uniref:CPBP family intramembrane glutamic endopeptidase n=1 Tax=Flectobacillus sp. TaxID=50419 RepID=UPI003B9B28B7